mgnify:CR=1 FL=1
MSAGNWLELPIISSHPAAVLPQIPNLSALRPMTRFLFSWLFVCAVALLVVGQLGCAKSSVDPALLAKYREKFSLSSEPPDVQTVYEVRETLLGADDSDHDHHDHEHADEHGHDHDAEDHAEHDHEHDEEHAHDEHEHEHPVKEVLETTEPRRAAMVGQAGGVANPCRSASDSRTRGRRACACPWRRMCLLRRPC